MNAVKKAVRGVDALNAWVARWTVWLVLVVTLETALSAVVLKVFDIGSNAFLEIRWYLFSAIFLLMAGYVLQKNAHVRIDLLAGRCSRRVQAVIDIFGTLVFLLPVSALVFWMGGQVFLDSWHTGEVSSSAGGLALWPARLLVPVGFALLMLQGLAEIARRVLFLCGQGPDPLEKADGMSAEEELANEIRAQQRSRGEEPT